MNDLQFLTAVGFGAVAVIIVSVLDFHVPYRISEIRNAVLRERYWFALAVYSTIAVIFYFLMLVICVGPLVFYLAPEKDDPLVSLALAISVRDYPRVRHSSPAAAPRCSGRGSQRDAIARPLSAKCGNPDRHHLAVAVPRFRNGRLRN